MVDLVIGSGGLRYLTGDLALPSGLRCHNCFRPIADSRDLGSVFWNYKLTVGERLGWGIVCRACQLRFFVVLHHEAAPNV